MIRKLKKQVWICFTLNGKVGGKKVNGNGMARFNGGVNITYSQEAAIYELSDGRRLKRIGTVVDSYPHHFFCDQ